MSEDNVHPINHGQIHFTIDGRRYKTKDREQLASALLTLAGLDPARYDLGELCSGSHEPVHYGDDDLVAIKNKARFVSIRHCADVA